MHGSPPTRLGRLSAATVAWGVVFAAAHFYWAAGGEAGMGGDAASTLGASVYIATIAVLGLVGAGVALGLGRPWGARLGRRRLRMIARLGAIALLLGVAVGVGRSASAGAVQDGAAEIAITAYFLLGGVLFAALSRSRAAA